MKYWRLYNSAEKEVGSVPQITEPVFEGYYTDDNQLWNNIFKKINNTTVIPKGHLDKRARLTDLMSVSFLSGQLFVSDKLRNIIEGFSTAGIQFANTEIITKTGEHLKSNIIHPYIINYSFIDMKNTEFQISNIMGDTFFEKKKFKTYEDYLEERKTLIEDSKHLKDVAKQKWISISDLVFQEDICADICSVFYVQYAALGFYVSQPLKDKILDEKCTGVIFREINERYP